MGTSFVINYFQYLLGLRLIKLEGDPDSQKIAESESDLHLELSSEELIQHI